MHILSILLPGYTVLCGAVEVARVVPSPVGDASQMFKHNAYVDNKVRQVASNFLNHAIYQQRKVVFLSSTSVLPSFASNLTKGPVLPSFTISSTSRTRSSPSASSGSATAYLEPGLLLPPPSNLSVGAFSNVTVGNNDSSAMPRLGNTAVPSAGLGASYLSRYAHVGALSVTKDLAVTASTQVSWENATDKACSSQLSNLRGSATNPYGVSACYNVRSVDNTTGVFHADLRLYRVTAANGDWTQLRNDGLSAGIAYPDASVSLEKYVQKRDMSSFFGSVMHNLQIRSGERAPQLLQTLSFLGQVNNDSVPELRIEGIAFALLTPQIQLSGSARNGTPISTLLSLQDASFVNGLFVNLRSPQAGNGSSVMAIGSREWVAKANTFSGFPISLALVGGWALVMLMLEGWDLGRRIRCRNEDLRAGKEVVET